jgi:hypothetical protein
MAGIKSQDNVIGRDEVAPEPKAEVRNEESGARRKKEEDKSDKMASR